MGLCIRILKRTHIFIVTAVVICLYILSLTVLKWDILKQRVPKSETIRWVGQDEEDTTSSLKMNDSKNINSWVKVKDNETSAFISHRENNTPPLHKQNILQPLRLSSNEMKSLPGHGENLEASRMSSGVLSMCVGHTLDEIQMVNSEWQVTQIDPRRVVTSPVLSTPSQVHIYLFSAYYDDRPIHKTPQVHLIAAVSFTTEIGSTPKVGLHIESSYCSLWLTNGSVLYTKLVGLHFTGLARSNGRMFKSPDRVVTIQYSFTCALEDRDYRGLVTHVSWSMRECELHNKVQLVVPSKELKGELAVCVPTLYGELFEDPRELPALIEWLEYYRVVGVHQVFLYNTSLSLSPGLGRVLEYYSGLGFLTLLHQPPPLAAVPRGQLYMASKLMCRAANMDCLWRNMYSHSLLISPDLDELYVSRAGGDLQGALVRALIGYKHTGWPQLYVHGRHFYRDTGASTGDSMQRYLEKVETGNPSTHQVKAVQGGLENNITSKSVAKEESKANINNEMLILNKYINKTTFELHGGAQGPMEVGGHASPSNKSWLVMTRHLHYTPADQIHRWSSKTIILPRLCVAMNNHMCLSYRGLRLNDSNILIHHYRRSCTQGHKLDASGHALMNRNKLNRCQSSQSQYDKYMVRYQGVLQERVLLMINRLNFTIPTL